MPQTNVILNFTPLQTPPIINNFNITAVSLELQAELNNLGVFKTIPSTMEIENRAKKAVSIIRNAISEYEYIWLGEQTPKRLKSKEWLLPPTHFTYSVYIDLPFFLQIVIIGFLEEIGTASPLFIDGKLTAFIIN